MFAAGRLIRFLRVATFAIAVACAVLVVVVLVGHGFDFDIGSIRVDVRRATNPVIFAVSAAALFVALNGWSRTTHAFVPIGRATRRAARATGLARINDRVAAVLVAVAVAVVGVVFATTAASASDAYGYVSQAELWLHGHIEIHQPWVADVPWPNAGWTFAPLGYRPLPGHETSGTLVPVYAPGLPMLLALAKKIGGQAGMFLVTPLAGALLVWSTFGIGRRLGSPKAGLIGACLVATSPAVLFMLMAPMTDVPVAACWTCCFWCLLGDRRRDAWLAGLAAGLAVLIRPNLVLGVAIAGLWYALRCWRPAPGVTRMRAGFAAGAFTVGPTAAVAVLLALNQHLYGSPFMSGYGSAGAIFSTEHFWSNVRRYSGWLVQTETLIALAGVAAVLAPIRWFWPRADRRFLLIGGLFVVMVWVNYCLFLEFNDWWYLRYLLSTWPLIMIGAGAVIVACARSTRWRRVAAVAAVALVAMLGVRGVRVAAHGHAFRLWKEERRYVEVGRLLRGFTPPDAVVLAMQHSGSARYYGGRVTIRYDLVDPDWIDRAVGWCANHGLHPYLLVEDWELPSLRDRFPNTRFVRRTDDNPLFVFRGTVTVRLFDLEPSNSMRPIRVIDDPAAGARDVRPMPSPRLAPVEDSMRGPCCTARPGPVSRSFERRAAD